MLVVVAQSWLHGNRQLPQLAIGESPQSNASPHPHHHHTTHHHDHLGNGIISPGNCSTRHCPCRRVSAAHTHAFLPPFPQAQCILSFEVPPKQCSVSPPQHTPPPATTTMDFDRSVSKIQKEQEKRRLEALRKAERYVCACLLLLHVALLMPHHLTLPHPSFPTTQ